MFIKKKLNSSYTNRYLSANIYRSCMKNKYPSANKLWVLHFSINSLLQTWTSNQQRKYQDNNLLDPSVPLYHTKEICQNYICIALQNIPNHTRKISIVSSEYSFNLTVNWVLSMVSCSEYSYSLVGKIEENKKTFDTGITHVWAVTWFLK